MSTMIRLEMTPETLTSLVRHAIAAGMDAVSDEGYDLDSVMHTSEIDEVVAMFLAAEKDLD